MVHGVENVFSVLWAIGNDATTDPSTILGHTALPHTTTYQEIVVDSYTNWREKYRCDLVLSNGTGLLSNEYDLKIECEHVVNLQSMQFVWSRTCAPGLLRITICVSTAAKVTISSLTLASRTATTLSVTWSGLRWRLWGRETEQMNRGQRS